MQDYKILMVGCGRMGGAIVEGLLASAFEGANLKIIEPSLARFDYFKFHNITLYDSISKVSNDFIPDIVVLAVKPQIMQDVLTLLRQKPNFNSAVFLSIAAGKKLDFIEKNLGSDKAIIRSMPNLPATVAMGTTVAIANKNVSERQRVISESLLSSIGECHFIEDESLLDPVTAISGSGPAYIFHFLEAMISAAEKIGLPKDLAISLSHATLIGSAELIKYAENTPTELRQQVTSPNGTTEAALKILMQDSKLENLIFEAAKAAKIRSIELGKD